MLAAVAIALSATGAKYVCEAAGPCELERYAVWKGWVPCSGFQLIPSGCHTIWMHDNNNNPCAQGSGCVDHCLNYNEDLDSGGSICKMSSNLLLAPASEELSSGAIGGIVVGAYLGVAAIGGAAAAYRGYAAGV